MKYLKDLLSRLAQDSFTGKVNILSQKNAEHLGHILCFGPNAVGLEYKSYSTLDSATRLELDILRGLKVRFVQEVGVPDQTEYFKALNTQLLIKKLHSLKEKFDYFQSMRPPKQLFFKLIKLEESGPSQAQDGPDKDLLTLLERGITAGNLYQQLAMPEDWITKRLLELKKQNKLALRNH